MAHRGKSTCVISTEPDGLAQSISEKIGASMITAAVRVFADGESSMRLAEKNLSRYDRAVIVQSLHPPVDTSLFRMLCLLSRAREDIRDVTAVIPYVGYARQDSEFLPGEIVTAKVLGQALRNAGASKIITVDIHSDAGLALLGRRKTVNVTAIPALARYFDDKMKLERPVAVSPDAGGAKRAEAFAAALGCGLLVLQKSRDRKTGTVSIKTKSAQTAMGRDAIIIDDMISTGGSIVKAAEFLKKQGCGRVFASCTHALLVDGAKSKIKRAGVSKIIGANTIPHAGRTVASVDISDEIAKALEDGNSKK